MHFNRNGTPNGWQYRTLPRFLIPVGVQVMLAGLFSSVAGLLLSRRSPLRCARSGGWVGPRRVPSSPPIGGSVNSTRTPTTPRFSCPHVMAAGGR